MTVFDFDTGPDGNYIEQLTVPRYEYAKPLRSSAGTNIDWDESQVFYNKDAHMFTGKIASPSTTGRPIHKCSRTLRRPRACNSSSSRSMAM